MPIKKEKNKVEKVRISNLSDFPGDEDEFVPDRITMEDLVGAEFIVAEAKVGKSERFGGEIVRMTIEDPDTGEQYQITTSAQGIVKAIKKYKKSLPWLATIVKKGRAYYFSKPK